MNIEELDSRILAWEQKKTWEELAKPPDIDTDDYTRAKAAMDRIFKKWRNISE